LWFHLQQLTRGDTDLINIKQKDMISLFPSRGIPAQKRRETTYDILRGDCGLAEHTLHCSNGKQIYIRNGLFKIKRACTCRQKWVVNSTLRTYFVGQLRSTAPILANITAMDLVIAQFGRIVNKLARAEEQRLKGIKTAYTSTPAGKDKRWLDSYDKVMQLLFGPNQGTVKCLELHTALLFQTQLVLVVPLVAPPPAAVSPQPTLN
jgi:hypothetical protein